MPGHGFGIVNPGIPVNLQFSPARGLLGLWMPIPNSGWRGGLTVPSLHRPAPFGTLNGAVTLGGPTRRGGYGQWNGFTGGNTTTTWIDCTANAILNPTGAGTNLGFGADSNIGLTLAAIFYSTSLAAENWLIGRDDNSLGRSYAFGVTSTGAINLQIGGSATLTTAETPITTNTWWFAMATGDGRANNWNVYWANLSGTTTGISHSATTAVFANPATTTGATTLGKRTFAANQNGLVGSLEMAGIWGRQAFQPGEVSAFVVDAARGFPRFLNWVRIARKFAPAAAGTVGGKTTFLIQSPDRPADGSVTYQSSKQNPQPDVKPPPSQPKQIDAVPPLADGSVTYRKNPSIPQPDAKPQSTTAKQTEGPPEAGQILKSNPSNYSFPPYPWFGVLARQADYAIDIGRIIMGGGATPAPQAPGIYRYPITTQAEPLPAEGRVTIPPVRAFAAFIPSVVVYRKTRSEVGTKTGSRQAGDK